MSASVSPEGSSRSTPNPSKGPRSTSRSRSATARSRRHVQTSATSRGVTVLLADDHAIVLEGLSSLLRPDFTLVGTVTDGTRLMDTARQLRPDVIVTDLSMPGLHGLDLLRRLKADALPAKVIVLTMHA